MKILVIGAVGFESGRHWATGYYFNPFPGPRHGHFAIVSWLVSPERAQQIVEHVTQSSALLFEEVPADGVDILNWLGAECSALEVDLWTTQSARHYPTFPAHLQIAATFARLLPAQAA